MRTATLFGLIVLAGLVTYGGVLLTLSRTSTDTQSATGPSVQQPVTPPPQKSRLPIIPRNAFTANGDSADDVVVPSTGSNLRKPADGSAQRRRPELRADSDSRGPVPSKPPTGAPAPVVVAPIAPPTPTVSSAPDPPRPPASHRDSAPGLIVPNPTVASKPLDLANTASSSAAVVSVKQHPTVEKVPQEDPHLKVPPTPPPPPKRRQKALLFTMDSITQYVEAASRGGPAGEIVVRRSLTRALDDLSVDVVLCQSDAQFFQASTNPDEYDFFFFDRWTYVSPLNEARTFLKGREHKTFLLDFFGYQRVEHLPNLPLNHVLTPYPTPWNAHLGFELAPVEFAPGFAKKRQGVVWGKEFKYIAGNERLLKMIAEHVQLHTTIGPTPELDHPNIVHHGHLNSEEWHKLLQESRFLLGLGDPLLGPSAVDAVAAGTMFINPQYSAPKLGVYRSQHQYLQEAVGLPYVCPVRLSDQATVLQCIREALTTDLKPTVPVDFRHDNYRQRVKTLLGIDE